MSQPPGVETRPYEPARYWEERLSGDFSLRGTGHISYSRGYNRWLYRRKAQVLGSCLAGVAEGAAALDVGSGTGWCARRLLERGMQVQGCDLTETSVQRLTRQLPQASFFRFELGRDRLPFADRTIAVVTAMDVLYHVTDDEAFAAALAELSRVLAGDGRLVVSDGFRALSESPARHVRFRSLREWQTAAGACGLAIERIDPLYRWLSRDPEQTRLRRLPGWLRGASEYSREQLAPRPPHMACAVLRPQARPR